MRVISDPCELQSTALAVRAAASSIGLVPTMGALHEGHLSLIRRARQDCEFVIVTIFVNPAQFGPGEDLGRYPRQFGQDAHACEAEGVDVIFAPVNDEMYPDGYETYVEVGPMATTLCGASRPGHFRGVATVCLKLFNLAQPAKAYFGMKDYQQLRIIQQMVADFNLALEIVPIPIVREPDGLALSSRNAYLTPDERAAAPVLRRALDEAVRLWTEGGRDPGVIRAAVREMITEQPLVRIDYVEAVDPETLQPPISPADRLLVAVAVFIGSTRLIDNVVLSSQ